MKELWERNPLFQINLAIDYAEKGIGIDNTKMLYSVASLTSEGETEKIWKAERMCGHVVYAASLQKLKEFMLKHEAFLLENTTQEGN